MPAPKKKVDTPKEEAPKKVESKEVKYRCDFNSWEEYNKYTGPKE